MESESNSVPVESNSTKSTDGHTAVFGAPRVLVLDRSWTLGALFGLAAGWILWKWNR